MASTYQCKYLGVSSSLCCLIAQIKSAKILCVGAGGIGCELLKTLVLTGFEDIELVSYRIVSQKLMLQRIPQVTDRPLVQIDMDTIETSNLNRQFLFRRRHVGESKAKVAADAVHAFRPNARIVAHQVFTRTSSSFSQYQLERTLLSELSCMLVINLKTSSHVLEMIHTSTFSISAIWCGAAGQCQGIQI